MAIVMVTGATGGIGGALVEILRRRGDEIYGVGRDQDRLAALGVHPVVADLTRPETLSTALPPLERLDVLVHSAGVVALGNVAETPYPVWQEHFAVNLGAAAELTRLLLPALRANPGWSAYAASKFGLRALADSLRAEERALRVTSIHPGRTATGMQQSVRDQEGGDYDPEQYIRPETVANLIVTALDTPPDAELIDLSVRYRL